MRASLSCGILWSLTFHGANGTPARCYCRAYSLRAGRAILQRAPATSISSQEFPPRALKRFFERIQIRFGVRVSGSALADPDMTKFKLASREEARKLPPHSLSIPLTPASQFEAALRLRFAVLTRRIVSRASNSSILSGNSLVITVVASVGSSARALADKMLVHVTYLHIESAEISRSIQEIFRLEATVVPPGTPRLGRNQQNTVASE